MKKLGYPLTWETHCFIDGGCNAAVIAHTNGSGDFVLFDQLGHPWPVHDCYLNRSRHWWFEERAEKAAAARRQAEFDKIERRVRDARLRNGFVTEIPVADIEEIARYEAELPRFESATTRRRVVQQTREEEQQTPVNYSGDFEVEGRITGIIEGAVTKDLKKLEKRLRSGGLYETTVRNAMDGRDTQLTVVDKDQRSFTFYADTSNFVIAPKDSVIVRLRPKQSVFPQASGRHRDDARWLFPHFVSLEIKLFPRLRRRPD
jgi:hypothetical protein